MIVTAYKRHSQDCKNSDNRNYAKCGCRMMLEGTATSDAEVRAVAAVFPGFSKRGRFRLSADTRNWAQAAEKARIIERRALDMFPVALTTPRQQKNRYLKESSLIAFTKRNASPFFNRVTCSGL